MANHKISISSKIDFLDKALEERIAQNSKRDLKQENDLVDFCSNDYLGFASSVELKNKIELYKSSGLEAVNGSSGSRLISGNSSFFESLETEIAAFHDAEAGLIFNSGYDANLGLFSAVPQRGDLILYDAYCHASIRDGIRLSNATSYNFRHNDVEHLRERLQKAEGRVFVAVESVYSMDGDEAPLLEIEKLCRKHKALLIVDEAHATGMFGLRGEGIVHELELQHRVFARVHTFGKALGVHGAIVLGSNSLREYLINFSRPFIYSTALAPHAQFAIKSAYDILSESNFKMFKVRDLTGLFKLKVYALEIEGLIKGRSPIQCFLVPGNDRVKAVAADLQKAGFDVRPILSPTVPKGMERLRVCLHAFNTEEQVDALLKQLKLSLENG